MAPMGYRSQLSGIQPTRGAEQGRLSRAHGSDAQLRSAAGDHRRVLVADLSGVEAGLGVRKLSQLARDLHALGCCSTGEPAHTAQPGDSAVRPLCLESPRAVEEQEPATELRLEGVDIPAHRRHPVAQRSRRNAVDVQRPQP